MTATKCNFCCKRLQLPIVQEKQLQMRKGWFSSWFQTFQVKGHLVQWPLWLWWGRMSWWVCGYRKGPPHTVVKNQREMVEKTRVSSRLCSSDPLPEIHFLEFPEPSNSTTGRESSLPHKGPWGGVGEGTQDANCSVQVKWAHKLRTGCSLGATWWSLHLRQRKTMKA